MGAAVEEGKGRGKGMNFELNLVPFIDLLSVCITFLLATAVWAQIYSLQVDQAISDPNATPPETPDEPPVPPLTVHIAADSIWSGRNATGVCISEAPPDQHWGCRYQKVEETYEWEKLKGDLEKDRAKYPDEMQVIIVTDDGVQFEHMIKALDMSRGLGYEKTLLGGGPAKAEALPLPTK
jgi:biopolymer transport protein TolR